MKKGRGILSVIAFISICATSIHAENLINLKIGLYWPKELLNSDISVAGDAQAEYGIIVDRKVAFGAGVDFIWNTTTKDVAVGGGLYKPVKDEKTFMFPVTGFILLDPVPHLIVHPQIKYNIGYNSMIYSYNVKDNSATVYDRDGYYYGLLMKWALDGIFNLGEQSGIFAGIEYQLARTKSAKQYETEAGEDAYMRRDMSGFGFRAGFRIMM
jgi:hypothetical protein